MELLVNKKMFLLSFSLAATFMALLIGGTGLDFVVVNSVGFLISFTLFILIFFKNNKNIFLPRSFGYLLIFLLFMALNIFWSVDRTRTFDYLLSFTSGVIFYLSFFNLSKLYPKIHFDKMILTLSFIFTLIFIYYKFILGRIPIDSQSLFLYTSTNRDHIHLGDIVSIALVILVNYFLVKPKFWQAVLFTMGLFFVAISLSRSAYLSLCLGILYLARGGIFLKKNKKIFWGIVVVISVLFVYATSRKSLLFARPYFAQALIGFFDNPWGVGVGNFKIISQAFKQALVFKGYSEFVENFVFELLVGMGIFVLPFLIWLLQIIKRLWGSTPKLQLLYPTIFIALTVNFMSDLTYSIPTMLWIWFISLGLCQEE